MCTCVYRYPQKQEEDIVSFRAGVTGIYELSHMGDKLNLILIIKQQVFLTPGPSLKPKFTKWESTRGTKDMN